MLRTLLAVPTAALALLLPVTAGPPALGLGQAQHAQRASRSVEIEGTLVAHNGRVAPVTLTPYQYDAAGGGWLALNDVRVSGGRFRIDVPPGTYRLRFTDSRDAVTWWAPGSPGRTNPDEAAAADLDATGRDLYLPRATLPSLATVVGRIQAPDGTAYDDARATLDGSTYVSSGLDGRYRFYDVPAGDHTITFTDQAGDYAPLTEGVGVSVAGTGTVTAPTATFTAPTTVAGTVTDAADGAPLRSITVTAYRWNGSAYVYADGASTGRSGRWSIPGLAAGRYTFSYSDQLREYSLVYQGGGSSLGTATSVTIADGESVEGIDQAMTASTRTPSSGVDLAGTATDTDGRTALGTTLTAYNLSGGFVDSATVTREGTFEFTDLPTGRYALQAFTYSLYTDVSGPQLLDEYVGGSDSIEGATVFSVTADDPTSVRLRLRREATVSGRVAGDGADPGFYARVQLSDATTGDYASVTPRADGRWTAYVEPGRYLVTFRGSSTDTVARSQDPYQDVFWPGSPTETGARLLTAKADASLTGVSARLTRVLTPVSAPRIVGTRRVGDRLTLTAGSWSSTVHTRVTWVRGGQVLARGRTWTPPRSEAGRTVTAMVLSTNGQNQRFVALPVRVAR